jgi:hypothetical protein
MNWKHLLVVVLAALVVVSACKKKDEKKTEAPVAEQPAEQPPAEQPPAEQPPAEQPPAEQPPAEQPPAEQPPAEQPPAAADACEAYMNKMIECVTAGMPPEAVEATVGPMKDAWKQSCDGFKAMGDDVLGKAMEACKDTACGAGGADWSTCIATKMSEIAMAAAGAAVP